ncbi:MAG: glycosyltransferase family 1 protein [Candidatus Nanohaloarchaea archaeon]|nr:glycosyltransferase family 1 protein [Candidatus Nanohaloarchaea archaeon]
MKVGIFSDVAETPNTGPGNIIYNLAEHVTERFSGEVVLLHTSDGSHEIYDGKDDIRISSNPVKSALQLRGEGFDIIHFDSVAKKESMVYPFLLDSALVATQYGDVHFADPDIRMQDGLQLYKKQFGQRFASRFLDRIMPLSESAKNNLVSGGIPERKLSVVNPGLDPLYEDMRDTVPLEEREPFLFHASQLTVRKNPETLLKAYEMVIDDGYDLDLKIAGKDWSREVVTSTIDSPAADRVELLGHISPEEVKEYYERCRLYLAPTRHEGFGLTAAEAMACGTPVISHNVYAVPEVVGDAGVLVDDPEDADAFADAVEQVLDDAELWNELSEKGRERAEQFSWENSAQQVIEIYDSVAAR